MLLSDDAARLFRYVPRGLRQEQLRRKKKTASNQAVES